MIPVTMCCTLHNVCDIVTHTTMTTHAGCMSDLVICEVKEYGVDCNSEWPY